MNDDSKIISIVPARVGSKGLKEKNFLDFAGKPLFKHAIEQGLRTTGSCIFSSDSLSALRSTNQLSIEKHMRKPELCSDSATMSEVLLDIVQSFGLRDETVILLQPTSPLRTDEDIHKAIKLYQKNHFDLVLSATETDNTFLKCGRNDNDRFIPVSDVEYCFSNRQALPKIYKPNGMLFVFKASWLLTNGGLRTNNIGMIPAEREYSIDVDNIADFHEAERLYQEDVLFTSSGKCFGH